MKGWKVLNRKDRSDLFSSTILGGYSFSLMVFDLQGNGEIDETSNRKSRKTSRCVMIFSG